MVEPAYEEGLRDLVAVGVVHADDGGVGDRRVTEEERFEFGGGDLVALVLDQFLDPVHDEEPAVRVDASDVTGVHPSVAVDHGFGGFGAAEVALHHLRAADEDLAVGVDPEVRPGVLDGRDPHLGARQQLPHGSGRRILGFEGHDMGAGREFRHAVRLPYGRNTEAGGAGGGEVGVQGAAALTTYSREERS